MYRMRPPKVPEQRVPVMGDEHLKALFRPCTGKTRRVKTMVRAVPPVLEGPLTV